MSPGNDSRQGLGTTAFGWESEAWRDPRGEELLCVQCGGKDPLGSAKGLRPARDRSHRGCQFDSMGSLRAAWVVHLPDRCCTPFHRCSNGGPESRQDCAYTPTVTALVPKPVGPPWCQAPFPGAVPWLAHGTLLPASDGRQRALTKTVSQKKGEAGRTGPGATSPMLVLNYQLRDKV